MGHGGRDAADRKGDPPARSFFIDTPQEMFYTEPTSKSQINNSYDYETFIIVIILNNVSVCRSKT